MNLDRSSAMEGAPLRSHRSGRPHRRWPACRASRPRRRPCRRACCAGSGSRRSVSATASSRPAQEGRPGACRGRAHAVDGPEVRRRHARPPQRRNLERAVADMSLDYCKQIKAAAEAVKSRITNIQVDESENLSDPDAAKRAASVRRSSGGWIGPPPSARQPVAPTRRRPAELGREADVRSFRQLAKSARPSA